MVNFVKFTYAFLLILVVKIIFSWNSQTKFENSNKIKSSNWLNYNPTPEQQAKSLNCSRIASHRGCSLMLKRGRSP